MIWQPDRHVSEPGTGAFQCQEKLSIGAAPAKFGEQREQDALRVCYGSFFIRAISDLWPLGRSMRLVRWGCRNIDTFSFDDHRSAPDLRMN
jgi:hypothetical protein